MTGESASPSTLSPISCSLRPEVVAVLAQLGQLARDRGRSRPRPAISCSAAMTCSTAGGDMAPAYSCAAPARPQVLDRAPAVRSAPMSPCTSAAALAGCMTVRLFWGILYQAARCVQCNGYMNVLY